MEETAKRLPEIIFLFCKETTKDKRKGLGRLPQPFAPTNL